MQYEFLHIYVTIIYATYWISMLLNLRIKTTRVQGPNLLVPRVVFIYNYHCKLLQNLTSELRPLWS